MMFVDDLSNGLDRRARDETVAHKETEEMPQEVTDANFDTEVIKAETPVLVDFWAEWCGPCHAVSPVLDKIAADREGELKLVKVNIDEEQELAVRYGVQSIPTMILFRDGQEVARLIGAMSKRDLMSRLDQHIAS